MKHSANGQRDQRLSESLKSDLFGDEASEAEESKATNANEAELTSSEREQFVRLVANHERRIYAYVLSLVPNWADAEEIFQETIIRLWRDFRRFDGQSNFGAWAISIAYYQVCTWRRAKARSRLVFGDATINAIAEKHEQLSPLAEARFRAMSDCYLKLTISNRELLNQCYSPGVRIEDVSLRLGKTRSSVYKALQRIRSTLKDCINRAIRRDQLS